MTTRPPHPDSVIAGIAAGQHGLVTRAQLRAAGFTDRMVDHRLAVGRLEPVHRGVYTVPGVRPEQGAPASALRAAPSGSRPRPPAPACRPTRTRMLAAVLACGPDAVLSHLSAAELRQLVAERPDEPVHVTVRRDCGRRPQIRIHRGSLGRDEVEQVDGIPVTSLGRTLLDVAGALALRELEQAIAAAERQGLVRDELRSMLRRRACRNRPRVLRLLLESGDVPVF
jgi:hypothetical protein